MYQLKIQIQPFPFPYQTKIKLVFQLRLKLKFLKRDLGCMPALCVASILLIFFKKKQ